MLEDNFISVPLEIKNLINPDQAWEYRIIPLNSNGNKLSFYIDENLFNADLANELEIIFGKKIEFKSVKADIIENTLLKYYQKDQDSSGKKHIKWDNEDFLENLIKEAILINSSDIHVEKYETKCRIRMRVDGKLIERHYIPEDQYPTIINKIKIKSNLDIAEKRLPQDGRINFSYSNKQVDIRVSSLPSLFGEKIVLRLLNKETTQVNINTLGLTKDQYEAYHLGITRPYGIILISGPTGSGKTTTLYATLKLLNNENVNILTIEDPIEYTLEGINQVQLKESIGLTFASALRTFLRQDPDIIMLGEIRDAETAQMAIRAALTGHLVLSTIHTNSAEGTISRLQDMGVPSFLIASTLNLSVAQRLVRILCPECKKKERIENIPKINLSAKKLNCTHVYVPVGCKKCLYTGYKGRQAMYELILINSEIEKLIREHNIEEIQKLKYKRLSNIAIQLLKEGKTSIDEVYSYLG